jgi:hypothetical protein
MIPASAVANGEWRLRGRRSVREDAFRGAARAENGEKNTLRQVKTERGVLLLGAR